MVKRKKEKDSFLSGEKGGKKVESVLSKALYSSIKKTETL